MASYSYPSAIAVDASWSGASAYSAPIIGQVDFSFTPFLPTSVTVSGFNTSGFGAPRAIQTMGVAGLFTQGYGTPILRQTTQVAGFSSGLFGLPSTPHRVSSLTAGQFGTPKSPQATLGLNSTRFGTPAVSMLLTAVVGGFASTTFGIPTYSESARAKSIAPGQFGAPTSRAVVRPSGFESTAFGFPESKNHLLLRIAGFKGANFGAPVIGIACQVHGLATGRFGAPTTKRSNTYLTYAINPSRFGQPGATRRFNTKLVTGFCSGSFGTHSTRNGYPVRAIPPDGRFGTPLLKRGHTTC